MRPVPATDKATDFDATPVSTEPFFHDWDGGDAAGQSPAQSDGDDERPVARSIAAFVLAGLVALSLIAAAVALIVAKWLPTGWLVGVVAVDAVASAGVIALLLTSRAVRHRARFVLGVLLSLVLIIVNCGVSVAGYEYHRLTNGITGSVNGDTIQYDIVALTSGPATLSDIVDTKMGQTVDDPNQDTVQQKIGELVSGITFIDQQDWSTSVSNLLGGEFPSIVIQDGFMQILQDADPTDYANLKILTNFTIKGTAMTPSGNPSVSPPPDLGPDQPFIVYISGIDTSGAITNRSRSDVNQLMVVNPKTGKVLLVSTPRDFYVQLADMPSCGTLKDKLTHSGVYGINVSVDTMNALYGINIDYYVRLNFTSLVTLIDAVGGIDVTSSVAFSAPSNSGKGTYNFVKGVNHLNGDQALAFARDRHSFATGDRQRGIDQQAVIAGVLAKVTQASSLLNAPAIISAISGSIQTSMTPDEISAQVQQQITNGTKWSITSMSANGSDASQYTCSYPHQKLYVMVPDQATVDAAKTAIQQVLAGN